MKATPGLKWHYKVDGRILKKGRQRKGSEGDKGWASEVREVVLGDFGFADDTTLVGEEKETEKACSILITTLEDWEEKAHPGKTEHLRLSGAGRKPFDVRKIGENSAVRQIGGILSESGKHDEDTNHRIKKCREAIRMTARAWGIGSKHGRGAESKVVKTVRLKIMKAAAGPTLLSFCRSRAWTRQQLIAAQRVLNYAVRRCMGMDVYNMEEHSVTDKQMYSAVEWETVEEIVEKASMWWLGHIARMNVDRRPKQALFGWWAGRESKGTSQRCTRNTSIKS